MIPRLFVSSTYFDLKHVRERLEKFIENYGFEPILFESDKVTYQHGKEIDQSAYFEVGLCHVMILIVGGRYGSPSSKESVEEERKAYDDDYISITRKEFETASKKNIPILIFVDRNVFSEYQTYKENQEFFDKLYLEPLAETSENKKFKFAHVDHINVFRFVDLLKTKPIKTFEKVEEIESYIKSQLSGMFYLYLESLKKSADDNKILDTISELNNVTLRMNEMLASVGKQILGEDKIEYEKVIENQFQIMLDFYMENFFKSIEFENQIDEVELDKINLSEVAKLIYEIALKTRFKQIEFTTTDEWLKKYRSARAETLNKLEKGLLEISDKLVLKSFQFTVVNKELHEKVLPFVKNQNDEDKIVLTIKTAIRQKLKNGELPF